MPHLGKHSQSLGVCRTPYASTLWQITVNATSPVHTEPWHAKAFKSHNQVDPPPATACIDAQPIRDGPALCTCPQMLLAAMAAELGKVLYSVAMACGTSLCPSRNHHQLTCMPLLPQNTSTVQLQCQHCCRATTPLGLAVASCQSHSHPVARQPCPLLDTAHTVCQIQCYQQHHNLRCEHQLHHTTYCQHCQGMSTPVHDGT